MMRWQFASVEVDDRAWGKPCGGVRFSQLYNNAVWTQNEPKGNMEIDLEQIISGQGVPKVFGWVYKAKEL